MKWQFPVVLLFAALVAFSQSPQGIDNPLPRQTDTGPATKGAGSNNALSVNDQLIISARDVDGLADATFRIDADGTITLPLVGKVRAEGLTVEQFEKQVTAQLGIYIRSPQVSVKRLTTRVDTVVVAGGFKVPGVYPLSDKRKLLEVITAVGGVQSNVHTIRITRQSGNGRAPLEGAIEDTATGVSIATISLGRLVADSTLRDGLTVEPEDSLFAASGGPVFLTGEVLKPGAFEVGDDNSLGVIELISMAGGLSSDAAPDKAMVLRPVLNGTRRAEIPVNLKDIQEGEASDFRVFPNDMLVVPRSGGKLRTVGKVMLVLAPALTGALIFIAVR